MLSGWLGVNDDQNEFVGDSRVLMLLIGCADELRRFLASSVAARGPIAGVSVDDLLQEIWITAFRFGAPILDVSEDDFRRWLWVTAKRRLGDASRKARAAKRGKSHTIVTESDQRTASMQGLFAAVLGREDTPSRAIARGEAAGAVCVALESLPASQRTAIRMHHLDGRSIQEVAVELKVSESAVSSLLYRGLNRLRSLMGDAERFLSGRGPTPPPQG